MIRIVLLLVALLIPASAQAFSGFYIGKTDARLLSKTSKVVVSRKDNRTVLTLASNFSGAVNDFAFILPVPTVIRASQARVTDNALIEQLDAYTAPRLVEYYDESPCQAAHMDRDVPVGLPSAIAIEDGTMVLAKALGVKIEEQYTIGEYDIQVLSAAESDGLMEWLTQQGYKPPKEAGSILRGYIKKDYRFFVAKVNVKEVRKEGFGYLRPIQVAYESEEFVLPIRLGMINAKGAQEMIVMALTQQGRVESSNYRTVRIPAEERIPLYVKDDFKNFYKDMFDFQVGKEDRRAVFLEYAWDMAWCEPCTAEPLSSKQLRMLGAWWVEDPDEKAIPGLLPATAPPAVNVFVTRLHLRYDEDTFPDDPILKETTERENFQARYVLQNPWKGQADCEAGKEYFKSLPGRFEEEVKNLADITGRKPEDIRLKMEDGGQPADIQPAVDPRAWWEKMWDMNEKPAAKKP